MLITLEILIRQPQADPAQALGEVYVHNSRSLIEPFYIPTINIIICTFLRVS